MDKKKQGFPVKSGPEEIDQAQAMEKVANGEIPYCPSGHKMDLENSSCTAASFLCDKCHELSGGRLSDLGDKFWVNPWDMIWANPKKEKKEKEKKEFLESVIMMACPEDHNSGFREWDRIPKIVRCGECEKDYRREELRQMVVCISEKEKIDLIAELSKI